MNALKSFPKEPEPFWSFSACAYRVFENIKSGIGKGLSLAIAELHNKLLKHRLVYKPAAHNPKHLQSTPWPMLYSPQYFGWLGFVVMTTPRVLKLSRISLGIDFNYGKQFKQQ